MSPIVGMRFPFSPGAGVGGLAVDLFPWRFMSPCQRQSDPYASLPCIYFLESVVEPTAGRSWSGLSSDVVVLFVAFRVNIRSQRFKTLFKHQQEEVLGGSVLEEEGFGIPLDTETLRSASLFSTDDNPSHQKSLLELLAGANISFEKKSSTPFGR